MKIAIFVRAVEANSDQICLFSWVDYETKSSGERTLVCYQMVCSPALFARFQAAGIQVDLVRPQPAAAVVLLRTWGDYHCVKERASAIMQLLRARETNPLQLDFEVIV